MKVRCDRCAQLSAEYIVGFFQLCTYCDSKHKLPKVPELDDGVWDEALTWKIIRTTLAQPTFYYSASTNPAPPARATATYYCNACSIRSHQYIDAVANGLGCHACNGPLRLYNMGAKP